MKGRDAAAVPGKYDKPVRTRIWFVAQWGPERDRGSPASAPECFRTVRVDSVEEAMAVAQAGAAALNHDAPWLAGGRVSKVLFPTESAPTEIARWLLAAPPSTALNLTDPEGVWRQV